MAEKPRLPSSLRFTLQNEVTVNAGRVQRFYWIGRRSWLALPSVRPRVEIDRGSRDAPRCVVAMEGLRPIAAADRWRPAGPCVPDRTAGSDRAGKRFQNTAIRAPNRRPRLHGHRPDRPWRQAPEHWLGPATCWATRRELQPPAQQRLRKLISSWRHPCPEPLAVATLL
jgi:hypothetical protein